MTNAKLVLVSLFVALACDKPSSDPDSPTGAGAGEGAGGDGAAGDAGKATPPPVERKIVVPKDHEQHGRFEGTGFANDCETDASCKTGGCSSEVCTAEEGVITSCEVMNAKLPPDASCGCVESQCVWWSPSGATVAGGDEPETPEPSGTSTDKPVPNSGDAPGGKTTTCGTQTCKPGQECIEYYGIAGPKGPKFSSCEVKCGKDGSCPKPTKCVTIADGPGRVCR